MELKTVVVTWMDGYIATYEDCTTNVVNGALHIFTFRKGIPNPVGEWHFPTSNIRAWGPEPWHANHGSHKDASDGAVQAGSRVG